MKLVLIVFLLLSTSTSLAQPQKSKRVRARDAVRAARLAATDDAKERAYKQVESDSIEDDQDVRAIAAEISEVPKVFKGDKARERRIRTAKHLAAVLAECKEPKHYRVVKELLDDEDKTLGRNYMGPWGSKSEDELERDTIKFEKLKALADAAGKGKNEQALPTLRGMRKKGGQAGKMAETTIGQIGRDEDLDEFVKEIKADPKSLINLSAFGRKSQTRILSEVKSGRLPSDVRFRLASRLPKFVEKDDVPQIKELLKDDNPRIVSVAAETVANSLAQSDPGGLREMLKDKNKSIRGAALLALNQNWDAQFLPDVLDALKTDSYEGHRSLVIQMLISQKIRSAIPNLREVAAGDSVPWVRELAQDAIRSLEK